jgi:hypothetical protein
MKRSAEIVAVSPAEGLSPARCVAAFALDEALDADEWDGRVPE